MEELQRIQRVLTRRFREAGRLYIKTKEILVVDGIDVEGEKKIAPHRIGVVEDPHHSEGNIRTLFALKEPYRGSVSLTARQRYNILGEGDLLEKDRNRVREIEDSLKIRVFDDHEDERVLPEIFPHQLRSYEGHPIVVGHKSDIYYGTVVLRPYGCGVYMEIEKADTPKIFGLGNFIGGTILVHDKLYRLTEHHV